MSKHLLSKSTFIRSIQCQKSLYLYKRHSELRDTISAEQQAIFARGHSVGFLARNIFSGGVDVGWKNPKAFQRSVKLTQDCIDKGINVIYEAAFLNDGILVAADIMVRTGEEWHLYEVKSSLRPSETFLRDAALQYRVITRTGLNLTGVSLIHLNGQYVRGEQLDIPSLFVLTDVTDQVKFRQAYVLSGIVAARETMRYTEIPNDPIGPHCFTPYPCDFLKYCWKDVPTPSIFNIQALEPEHQWKLYNKGIIGLKDMPQEYAMTNLQQAQFDSLLNNKAHIDAPAIIKQLNRVKFPAIFADFTAIRPGVPLLKNTRPYQQIPFMISAVRLSHIAAPPTENIFIADAAPGVMEKFLLSMLSLSEGVQSVVVFDKQKELYIFKDLEKAFPHYAEQIQDFVKKLVDLAEILRTGLFFHPGMKGEYNLQQTLQSLGINNSEEEQEIKSSYLAGVAFEGCFAAPDLFYSSNVQNMLRHFCMSQSRMVHQLYFALREQALSFT